MRQAWIKWHRVSAAESESLSRLSHAGRWLFVQMIAWARWDNGMRGRLADEDGKPYSLRQLGVIAGMQHRHVRTLITEMEALGMITHDGDGVLRVVSYDDYQGGESVPTNGYSVPTPLEPPIRNIQTSDSQTENTGAPAVTDEEHERGNGDARRKPGKTLTPLQIAAAEAEAFDSIPEQHHLTVETFIASVNPSGKISAGRRLTIIRELAAICAEHGPEPMAAGIVKALDAGATRTNYVRRVAENPPRPRGSPNKLPAEVYRDGVYTD